MASDTSSSRASNADWLARAGKVLLQNYRPAPLFFTDGKGCRVRDAEGRWYLDFVGGLAVTSVGHGHPELARAIGEQAALLMQVSNLFYNTRSVEFAEALTARTGYERVFFCNSGTEANEAMMKLARRYHFDRDAKERVQVVAATNSFHGRTLGSLSATGQPKYQQGIGPLPGGITFVPYGDFAALKAAVTPETAAVLLEPIQAEGGIIVPPEGYFRRVRELCTERGALLLLDEVQTGCGRTGHFLAQQGEGITADATSLAKGIAGGFPLGAMLVREAFAGGLPPGSHASTFGGNPLACSAGLAVLSIVEREGLLANVQSVGAYLATKLSELVADAAVPAAVAARGRGLLQGLELHEKVDPAVALAAVRERGVLLSIAGGKVLRFSSCLSISTTDVDECLAAVRSALATLVPA